MEVSRARAQAEFAELAWLLTEYTSGVAAIDEPQSWHGRSEEMGVVMDLALATGYSEQQVRNRLSAMRTVRDHLPATWLSFRAGDIDAARTTQLANAANKLERPDSLVRLDQNGSTYAAGHNNSELRRWITRFCATIEPLQTNEASEKARGLRHVRVHHDGDGMAWLNAFIPSAVAAAAADRRLNQAARVLEDEPDGPDGPRSLQHKRADLLGAWLTHGDETISTPTVHMDVAVTVPVEALAGHTDLPVASYDHSWTMPADWLTALAGTGNTLWHRIVTDPAGGVLDHTYLGRFAPDILATALAFRDQVCTATGCTTPARQCEKDPPQQNGPTAGWNLDDKCKCHHRMKGSGVLSAGLTRPRHSQAPPPDEHQPSTCCSMENHALAAALVEYFDREQTTAA